LPNGCLQQIAANRFSIPQDVIAILLQGFVRHVRLCLLDEREGAKVSQQLQMGKLPTTEHASNLTMADHRL
jgi:hypothetical protein